MKTSSSMIRRIRAAKPIVLALLASAALFGPAPAPAAVVVDQSPLTVRQPLAPNLVLMLDDSGSMSWNFMPDICYLNGVSCSGTNPTSIANDAMINSANNGVYYDPTATYTPPYKVDGTNYANSPSFTSAWADGFLDRTNSVDLTFYARATAYSTSNLAYAAAYDAYGSSSVTQDRSYAALSTTFTTANYLPPCPTGLTLTGSGPTSVCTGVLTQTPTCSSGTYSSSTGTCVVTPPTPTCSSGTLTGTGSSMTCLATQTPSCASGYTFNSSTGFCAKTAAPTCAANYTLTGTGAATACTATATPSCNSGYTFSSTNDRCEMSSAPTCPSGYSLSGSGASTSCTRPATATPSCNSGYTFSSANDRCELISTPTCPGGYSLTGSGASRTCSMAVTATPSCNSGYSFSSANDRCEKISTPTCPTNYSLVGSGASTSCSSSQTPTCSSGGTFSNGSCSRGSIRCNTGYTYNSTTRMCQASATPTCATGNGSYQSSTGQCLATQSPPNCASGYSYNSSSNLCAGTATTTPTCAIGTYQSGTGQCLATQSPPNCASGYSYNSSSNLCTTSATTATPTCATGTYQSGTGQCLATQSPPNCASGYSYSNTNNLCMNSGVTVTPLCSGGQSYQSSTGLCLTTQPPTCPTSGYSLTGSGASTTCARNTTPTCSSGSYSNGQCVITPPTPACASGYSLSGSGASLICTKTTTQTPTCNSGDTYTTGTGFCTNAGATSVKSYNYFQFSTGPAAGPYAIKYVASSAQKTASPTPCSIVPSSIACYYDDDTSGAIAPAGVNAGQNIANWFSYYRTRMLTAKSGLLVAFNQLDVTVRLGFGSINGNSSSSLPTSRYTSGSNTIATVSPFGSGASGTQRANFWTWVLAANATNSTPLRSSLAAVGEYYKTAGPWQTSTTDTTERACRQSYTILTTDGFWNDSHTGTGDADGTAGTAITGTGGQSYTYSPVVPFKDCSASGCTTTQNTLADVAMKYWKTDLRPATNEVPPSTEDPAFWQHMSTFTMGLGFPPTGISPSGTTIDQIFKWSTGGTPITGFSWPTPASGSINNIADLAHAAVNGRGGFYSVTKPLDFSAGIQDVLRRVAERVGAGSSLAANSTKLQTGTTAYQAVYTTGKWKGDLRSFAVNPDTGALAVTPSWVAANVMPAHGSRTIYTYNASGNFSSGFIAFDSAALSSSSPLSNTQKTALGGTSTVQTDIINYLRGDSSKEVANGGAYRSRDTSLGDIINSQPIYVGAPDPNLENNKTFSGSSAYTSYAADKAGRTPTIWVAANDGMLHSFNANSGVEVFAYLPASVILGGVASLANTAYGSSALPHNYYNDGELTVADVYLGSTSGWRTILVGTTGRGLARAVYALDVTDPAAPTLLWERYSADGLSNSNYIGQITSKPIIAQTADGVWSVLIGNGYNSTAGAAALLQFAITDGTLSVHATTDTSSDNGLSAPAVWMNSIVDNISTTAYAGDLKGAVWSFNLASSTSTGQLLFSAVNASGAAQPITSGLLAGKDPTNGNLWVFFGTGGYLTQNTISPAPPAYLMQTELGNTGTQTWYGIIVQPGPSQPANLTTNLSNGRSALVRRSITAETAPNSSSTPPTLGSRAVSAPTASDMVGKSGWYLDLVPPSGAGIGERMVTPNQFQGSLLIGTTRVPTSSDPCFPSGSGWVMALSPFTGAPPSSLFFDINGDNVVNNSDAMTVGGQPAVTAGIGFSSVPSAPIFVGNTLLESFDNGTTGNVTTTGSVGPLQRVSWREMVGQ